MAILEDDQSQDACGQDDFPVETVGALVGCRLLCSAPSNMGIQNIQGEHKASRCKTELIKTSFSKPVIVIMEGWIVLSDLSFCIPKAIAYQSRLEVKPFNARR